MFQAGTSRAAKALKLGLAGAAFACTLATTTAASAAEYVLQSVTMDTSNFAHIYSATFDNYYYAAPFQITANLGAVPSTPTFSFVAWCVDIFHGLDVEDTNLHYNDNQSLTTDSNFDAIGGPTALNQAQIDKVARLIDFGDDLFNSNDADKIDKLAAVQGAIWATVAPAYTVEMYNNPNASSYLATYVDPGFLAGLTPRHVTFLTEDDTYGSALARQGLAITINVPEPGTWVMLIGGFGMIGAALRRRRALAA
jgi:hypothetical protein